ncbi:hypothetical protein IV203_020030 [Nitzschia inconspicua]|uniref:Uncharacterized protein n=1 Tax=Nitzschia inconspicua TaxID=303405 RepID=A0A9K3M105_9STRA|nr:hypothetical protein IV203_020030 [Nitzschia inconspicua]
MAIIVAEDDSAVFQSTLMLEHSLPINTRMLLVRIFIFAAISQSLAHLQADADDNYFFRDPFQASSHRYFDNLGDTEEVDVVDVQTLANASGYNGRIVDNNHFLINSKQIPRMTVISQSKRRS